MRKPSRPQRKMRGKSRGRSKHSNGYFVALTPSRTMGKITPRWRGNKATVALHGCVRRIEGEQRWNRRRRGRRKQRRKRRSEFQTTPYTRQHRSRAVGHWTGAVLQVRLDSYHPDHTLKSCLYLTAFSQRAVLVVHQYTNFSLLIYYMDVKTHLVPQSQTADVPNTVIPKVRRK